MKLISNEKITELRISNPQTKCTSEEIRELPQSFIAAAYWDGVTKGIEFAETELKNLAIEYAEWISTQRDYKFCKSKNVWTLYGKSGEFDLTSKQLFDKFINQRNKS